MTEETALSVIPQAGVTSYRLSTDAADLSRAIVLQTAMEIQGRKYVKVEGWQAIAVAHGCTASSGQVERVDGGFKATGQVRRMDTGAVIAEAEGFVGEDEPVWFGGEGFAYGKPKTYPKRPDYAIRAMAQTRAISRACRSAFAHVVVMIDKDLGTTPAEEMQGVIDHQPDTSPARFATEARADGLTTETRSTYEITAAKKAAAWVQSARGLFKDSLSIEEIDGWWTDNFKATDKLEAKYPDLHKQLVEASENERDRLAAVAA